jgi:hypothetical protein
MIGFKDTVTVPFTVFCVFQESFDVSHMDQEIALHGKHSYQFLVVLSSIVAIFQVYVSLK